METLHSEKDDDVTMKLTRPFLIFLLILIISTCCIPAAAILQPFTFRGYVTGTAPGEGNLSLIATHTWRCTFDNTTVECGWEPVSPLPLTGKVPDMDVFAVAKPGTVVEVSSLGTPGGYWTGVGVLAQARSTRSYAATDLFGDLPSLPAPLASGYSVDAETEPDCGNCTGSTCPASAAMITLKRDGEERWTGRLLPGEMYRYSDPLDHSGIEIRLVSGKASSSLCPEEREIMTGPQPVSVFVVHVTPGSGTTGPEGRTSRNGSVSVFSFPPGAVVDLDGRQAGVTPLFLPGLDPGEYTLVLRKEGYAPWEKVITVREGRRSMVSASLEPLYGDLRLLSSPAGAGIFLNGAEAGITPAELTNLPPGTYTITFSKDGYLSENRTAVMKAGQRRMVYAALSPIKQG